MEKLKYLLITLSFLIISSLAMAQKYNSQKQYPDKPPLAKKEYGEAQLDFLTINEELYPKINLSGYSMYDSRIGMISFAEIGRINKNGFKNDSLAKTGVSILISGAVMFNISPETNNNNYTFLGVGYYDGKDFWGPIAGFNLQDQKWRFSVLTQIDVNNNDYSTSEDKFDPNSWYRVYLLRKINKQFSLGLYSERFYYSGLTAEYEIGHYWKVLKGLSLKAYAGKEIEFGGTAFGLGLKICTLDKKYGRRY